MNAHEKAMLDKHGTERLSMYVRQAQDWVDLYKLHGPRERMIAWENTLLYRISLLKAAMDHEFAELTCAVEHANNIDNASNTINADTINTNKTATAP